MNSWGDFSKRKGNGLYLKISFNFTLKTLKKGLKPLLGTGNIIPVSLSRDLKLSLNEWISGGRWVSHLLPSPLWTLPPHDLLLLQWTPPLPHLCVTKNNCLRLGLVSQKRGSREIQAGDTQFSSVAQSCPTLCNLMDCKHTRFPCPSPTPRIYSNSCLSSLWCPPTISPSVGPFSSCHQSFPASGSFPMSQFFASGGQSIGVSASASVLLMNIQGGFPLGLVGSPCSPRDSQEFSPAPQFKSINSLVLSFL